ncbi:MAG: glycosyltransferase [Candidatus Diapherotrites archaeon]|nr:glycosyltransferase [Candidatus Diapherotrites archaeon]
MDVSVIIPTLNEEKYIGNCLESLINQQFSGSFEIIIGDGGSTDMTKDICKEYGVKFVVEKKPTIAAGRQKACEKAKGKVILSTDADAILEQQWIDVMYSSLEDGYVCVYGNVVPYDGTSIDTLAAYTLMPLYMKTMALLGMDVPAGSNMGFKKKAFDMVGGFNTDIIAGEDLDLVKRLKHIGNIRYNRDSIVHVSARRMHKWGRTKYLLFHTTNAVKVHTIGVGHKRYEPVR